MPAASDERPFRKSKNAFSPSFPLIVTWIVLTVVAFSGGASRADELMQAVVRIGAIVGIATLLLSPARGSTKGMTAMILFYGAAVALVALQLIPLPPSLWAQLPGREIFADVRTMGIGDPWRPISVVPDRTWNSLMSMFPPGAMLVCWAYLSPRERIGLVAPVAAIAVFSAALGIAQLSQGPDSALRWYSVTSIENSVGLFANRNHQALLLAITLPLLAIWGTTKHNMSNTRFRGWLALGLIVFVALAIPVTGSRAGLFLGAFGLVVAAAVFAEGRSGKMPRKDRGWIIFGMIILLAAAAISVGIAFGRDESVQRLLSLGSQDNTRRNVIGPMFNMIPRFFPIGIGFGSFEATYKIFEPFNELSREYLNQAHNDFLQIVLEGGFIGSALLCGFGVWLVRRALVVVQATRRGDRLSLVALSIIAMILAASAVDYPLRTPLLMTFFVVFAGWIAQHSDVRRTGDREMHGTERPLPRTPDAL
jgi:O-Antigen ligase